MKLGKNNLSKQLLILVGVAFVLMFVSLGAILPRILIPVAEDNIYNYLTLSELHYSCNVTFYSKNGKMNEVSMHNALPPC